MRYFAYAGMYVKPCGGIGEINAVASLRMLMAKADRASNCKIFDGRRWVTLTHQFAGGDFKHPAVCGRYRIIVGALGLS